MTQGAIGPEDDTQEAEAGRWLAASLRDLDRAEAAVRDDPKLAVFLYQQAAEKGLKAVLWAERTRFGFTHSLDRLLVLVGRKSQFLACPGDPELVSSFATRFRYPSPSGRDYATEDEVAGAQEVSRWLVA